MVHFCCPAEDYCCSEEPRPPARLLFFLALFLPLLTPLISPLFHPPTLLPLIRRDRHLPHMELRFSALAHLGTNCQLLFPRPPLMSVTPNVFRYSVFTTWEGKNFFLSVTSLSLAIFQLPVEPLSNSGPDCIGSNSAFPPFASPFLTPSPCPIAYPPPMPILAGFLISLSLGPFYILNGEQKLLPWHFN